MTHAVIRQEKCFIRRVLGVGFVANRIAALVTWHPVPLQQYSLNIFILMLLLSEGRACETCDLSKDVIVNGKLVMIFIFQYIYRESFIILYYDQQMQKYFTNYHTATCFETIVSSSDSL